ncbi:MAG: hypothetical protein WC702_04185 [Patescibacteria group bacterium]|jgi:hypothetical protein
MNKGYLNFSEQGMSILLPVLLIGFIGIAVFLTLAAGVVVSLSNIGSSADSSTARGQLFACLDEYLVHLPNNSTYAPASINLLDVSCDLTVLDPEAEQKQAIFTAEVNDVTRHLTATVEVSEGVVTIIKIIEPSL